MSTPYFAMRLIDEVEKRPPLWNRFDENYNNRALADALWTEIGIALDRGKETMKSRWRNIRDQYQRELKRQQTLPNGELEEYCGQWAYFDRMAFLKDMLLPGITKKVKKTNYQAAVSALQRSQNEMDSMFEINHSIGNVNDPLDSNDAGNYSDTNNICKIEPSSEADDCSNDSSMRQYEAGVKRRAETEEIITQTKKACTKLREFGSSFSGIDDDFCFVVSLVPYLKKLTTVRKLIVRNEIQSLVIKEFLCDKCRENGQQAFCPCTKL